MKVAHGVVNRRNCIDAVLFHDWYVYIFMYNRGSAKNLNQGGSGALDCIVGDL